MAEGQHAVEECQREHRHGGPAATRRETMSALGWLRHSLSALGWLRHSLSALGWLRCRSCRMTACGHSSLLYHVHLPSHKEEAQAEHAQVREDAEAEPEPIACVEAQGDERRAAPQPARPVKQRQGDEEVDEEARIADEEGEGREQLGVGGATRQVLEGLGDVPTARVVHATKHLVSPRAHGLRVQQPRTVELGQAAVKVGREHKQLQGQELPVRQDGATATQRPGQAALVGGKQQRAQLYHQHIVVVVDNAVQGEHVQERERGEAQCTPREQSDGERCASKEQGSLQQPQRHRRRVAERRKMAERSVAKG